MKTSENTAEISAALVAFQGELVQPDKNRTVNVRTKQGGSYEFAYATLDNIIAKVREPLAKNGLAVVQMLGRDEHGLILTTRITHKTGEFIEDYMPVLVGPEKTPQAIGSAATYSKRYAYCAALGIVADEDDDANSAEGNQVEIKGNGAKRAAPKAPPAPIQQEVDPFAM